MELLALAVLLFLGSLYLMWVLGTFDPDITSNQVGAWHFAYFCMDCSNELSRKHLRSQICPFCGKIGSPFEFDWTIRKVRRFNNGKVEYKEEEK
ncbi:hypothetical protein C4577_05210 [Candidatus Parcubacteria bacterium]|nr:MAG: hypothetical protein C4577_05210 [Candidatus Parcubacteria bacterium]